MIKIWNVNDYSKIPPDKNDWSRRMNEIAALAKESKRRNHKINFVVKAFDMISDCGMLTKETVENLSNKNWCDSNINFGAEIPPCKMNPLGGVLRKEGLTMWDENNLRYYCPLAELVVPSDIETANKKALKSESKLAVNCNDIFYYISNDWLNVNNARPTKNNFYFWIALTTKKACGKFWQ